MNGYILDTDHVTLYRHGHSQVGARADIVPADKLAITIITAEEQLSGWYTQVRKGRTPEKLARAYQGLFDVVDMLKQMQVVPFTLAAVQRYLQLRTSLPRLDRNDLAIAAIVLEVDDTLVTRNWSDFQQVPGLKLEDWSKP